MRALHRHPGGQVRLETDSGRVDAGAAVLAINAAARGLRPFRGRLAVASSHVVLTEPVGDVLDALGWTGGESITDPRTMLHYMRPTRDRRIAFGWAGGRLAYGARLRGHVELDPGAVRTVHEHLVQTFPMLRGRRITHAWGGPIDASPNRLLQIDSLAGDRVHTAFGFSGNGVGPSHLAGRILADLALDRRTELTRLPVVGSAPGGVPPEPLAWVGGSVVRAAMVRRDRLHDKGRRPDPLTRLACRAPQLLGIHLAR